MIRPFPKPTLCPRTKLRLPRRTRVTLIAGWRCQKAVVIHADTQETIGDYRATVQKIVPEVMGNFQIIVAGSGPGELIDSFIVRLRRKMDGNASDDIQELVRTIEAELEMFNDVDVRLSPIPAEEKRLKFIFAACCPASGTYDAWVTSGIRLERIADFKLAGWEEPLYENIGRRLYASDMTLAQAVLAGTYLFTIAEGTSNYIRGPFSVAVVTSKGISMEKEEYIRDMQDRLKVYETQINRIFLACSDTSVQFLT